MKIQQKDSPSSRQKFSKVSHLVPYNALAGFHTCVYNMRQYVLTKAAEAHQSIKHIDTCRIHEETNVTSWHGSRQSHCNSHAHNVAWICIYANRLECIPTLQGQELLWSQEVPSWSCESIIQSAWSSLNKLIYIYIYVCIDDARKSIG